MKYEVQTVADHEFPTEQKWAIVERDGEPPILLIGGDAARCWEFLREWENAREESWQPTICLPRLRAVS